MLLETELDISAVITDRDVWMLVTRYGGDDPEGRGGYIVPNLGGSGCRWLLYDPANHEASLRSFYEAQAFHQRGELDEWSQ